MRINIQEWQQRPLFEHPYEVTRYILTTAHGAGILETFSRPLPHLNDATAFFWSLQVDQAFRCEGIAAAIIETAERIAAEEGCPKIALEYYPKVTEKFVREWHERRGYNATIISDDCFLMEKQLAPKSK